MTARRTEYPATVLVPGNAAGTILALDEPLSLWGGVDPSTGAIIANHPQEGEVISGRILVSPAGRGSSSSSNVLAEAIRADTAPAAIVLGFADDIIALGSLVARELYGRWCPVVVADLPEGLTGSFARLEERTLIVEG